MGDRSGLLVGKRKSSEAILIGGDFLLFDIFREREGELRRSVVQDLHSRKRTTGWGEYATGSACGEALMPFLHCVSSNVPDDPLD